MTAYVAPLDQRFNPHDPATVEFGQDWLSESVVYVMSKPERTRPTRVLISSGDLGEAWDLGNKHFVRHDQGQNLLGRYSVVGIAHYDDAGNLAYTEGEVPDRKIAAAVFK